MQLKEAVQNLEDNGYRIGLIRREFSMFEKYDNYPTRNKKADRYWKKEKPENNSGFLFY